VLCCAVLLCCCAAAGAASARLVQPWLGQHGMTGRTVGHRPHRARLPIGISRLLTCPMQLSDSPMQLTEMLAGLRRRCCEHGNGAVARRHSLADDVTHP